MNDIDINDKRNQSEFKNHTFSKYSKTHVKNELIKAFYNQNIEPACYWSVELICAGHYSDLWSCIIQYTSKYIHIGNPKLFIYLSKRLEYFKQILYNGYTSSELELRNNKAIRQLFAEIITIVTLSKKKHPFESYAIKDFSDFDITNMTNRLKAPSTDFGKAIFQPDDPKEIFIAINEYMFQISQSSKDLTSACYWIEWICKFESLQKIKKNNCEAERRNFVPVQDKFQKNIIWLLWEGLLNEASKRSETHVNIIKSLLDLFCIKFTLSSIKQRRFILYTASSFLTEVFDYNNKLVNNTDIIKNISNNIDIIYKEVKKNEIKPDTDYLFNNVDSNTEKSLNKLETLNLMLNKSGS